jgi:carbon storage regulator
MLVLSRHRNEVVMIDLRGLAKLAIANPALFQEVCKEPCEVMLNDIRGEKVRLGFTFPDAIPVHRKEVFEAIQRGERREARVMGEVEF